MGDLQQNAGSISGLRVTATGSPVAQVQQDFQGLANNLVGPSPIYVGNKANATAILFELRIIKTLFGG